MGYIGLSHSENAELCYNCGIFPLSVWNKELFFRVLKNDGYDTAIIEKLKSYNWETLKYNFLVFDSWHHTSAAFNRTDFYTISEYMVAHFDPEKIIVKKTEKPTVETWQGINIFYFDTVSRRARRRWHSEKIKRVVKNATVEKHGAFYFIKIDGQEIKRKECFILETGDLLCTC